MEIWMEGVRPSTRSEVAALEMADFKCGADSYLPGRGTTFLPYDSTPNLDSPGYVQTILALVRSAEV